MKHFIHNSSLSVIAFVISFMMFVCPSGPNAATNDFTFEELTIVLMPEYNLHPDKKVTGPNLLVGFHGKIMNQSKEALQEVEIPVPSKEQNFVISLAAVEAVDESIEEIKYTLHQNEGTITLHFANAIEPKASVKFMIEYFYSPIKIANEQKTFAYSYTSIADAALMNVMLFEPYGTESLKVTPASDKQATDSMGVKMHLFEYTNVKAGDKKQYSISYVKKDDITTIEKVEQITSQHSEFSNNGETEQPKTLPNDSSFNTELIIGVGLIFVIGLTFAALLIKRKGQNKANHSSNNLMSKKELRKLLAEGKIDEKQYAEEISKLK